MIGLEDIASDLVAPADVGLGRGACAGLGVTLLKFQLVEPGLELFHRLGAILVLASLVLALHHDVGRDVGDPDRAVGGVDVLPARAARAEGVDAKLAFVDFDVNFVVDFGINPDAREAGVAARRAVVGRNPHQPVDPALDLEIAVGVLALDQQGRRLDPGLFAGVMVDQFDLHSVALGPARIHPLEHPGPVVAFGAAGTGVDLDVAVVGIRLAREQGGNLVAVGPLGKLGKRANSVVDQRDVALGLGHLDELDGIG